MPERTFFLFGPRSTGKTTWLRANLGSAAWFDLLDQGLFMELLRDPGLLYRRVAALPQGSWAVIDEVQKLPQLLDEVHRVLSGTGGQVRFALTGSSARKLKRGGANLLAGRAINKKFFPLVGAELNYEFDVDELLTFGNLPPVRVEPDASVSILEAYAANYLKEEIQQEAIVREIGSFTRFLDIAAIMNGQVLNVSNVAREAGVHRATVERYFEVLADTLISVRIPAWQPRAKVKEVAAPKFFFFDCGVVRALSRRVRLPLSDAERGPLLETLILNELRGYMNQEDTGGELHYWRTPTGSEIDFVWSLGDVSVGIEVKAATRWRPQDGRALKEIIGAGKISRGFGVYRGTSEQKDGAVWVFPVKEFMKRLQAGEIISA